MEYLHAKKSGFNFRPVYLMLPCVVFLLFLIIYPFGYNIVMSLYDISFLTGRTSWTGLGNYLELFQDPYFHNSVRVTIILVLSALVVETLLGLASALFLSGKFKGRGLARMLLIIPLGTIPVINGYLFKLIFFPGASVATHILMQLGLVSEEVHWLTDPVLANITVVAADAWQWTPFMMLIMLAGLQAIPQQPYELAALDGLSPLRVFFKITLPQMKQALAIAILIRTMDLLRLFDAVFALTGGGPQSATETVAYYIYRTGFQTFRIGYASATSLVVWATIFVIAFVAVKKIFKEPERA
ncbi:MAG TPA: sugar ABC transporter permease [Desulfobacteria bacterium]|nr:sugar ABC transporter permease [Desulfobacteria bacterium]